MSAVDQWFSNAGKNLFAGTWNNFYTVKPEPATTSDHRTATILRSQIDLLEHEWPLNNDHLSIETFIGSWQICFDRDSNL